jgi:rhodanese-related sulfurtransferase
VCSFYPAGISVFKLKTEINTQEEFMTKVTVDEIRNRLNDKHLTIVDSRAPHVWDEADVKASGAIRIPPDEAEKHIADVSRDDYVVTYCT